VLLALIAFGTAMWRRSASRGGARACDMLRVTCDRVQRVDKSASAGAAERAEMQSFTDDQAPIWFAERRQQKVTSRNAESWRCKPHARVRLYSKRYVCVRARTILCVTVRSCVRTQCCRRARRRHSAPAYVRCAHVMCAACGANDAYVCIDGAAPTTGAEYSLVSADGGVDCMCASACAHRRPQNQTESTEVHQKQGSMIALMTNCNYINAANLFSMRVRRRGFPKRSSRGARDSLFTAAPCFQNES
jgi:hypothetical protein